MKEIKKTLEYVKKNKLRSIGCLALDVLFVIIFLALMLQYMPSIQKNVIVFNQLMDESGTTEIGSLTKLSAHAEEINLLGKQIREDVGKLTISILLLVNIVYTLFFSIILKKLKSWYPVMFFGISVIIQGVLWLIFRMIIDVKGFVAENVVLPEKSMSSVVLFILICYVIYFIGLVAFVEMRKKKAIKNSLDILKRKGLKLFFIHIIVGIIFWFTLAFLQLPLALEIGAVGMLIMLILTIGIFFCYFTLSKIFLIECVVVAEGKNNIKNIKKKK